MANNHSFLYELSDADRSQSSAEANYHNSNDLQPQSPGSADLHDLGYSTDGGKTWHCYFPECTNQAKFTRDCDLRKHFKKHTMSFPCRRSDCPQSIIGVPPRFTCQKDRDRHEQRHTAEVICAFPRCDQQFSKIETMRDHVKRIHPQKSEPDSKISRKWLGKRQSASILSDGSPSHGAEDGEPQRPNTVIMDSSSRCRKAMDGVNGSLHRP